MMLMVSNNIRIGVVTGHVPLKDIPSLITESLILSKIRILNESINKDFSIRRPRIAILGLNPHAGDNGVLGIEEQNIIIPAVNKAKEEGIFAFGPFAADGFFGSSSFTHFDAVLAMYHDQGLIPFKSLSFGSGVNYTAGLSIIGLLPRMVRLTNLPVKTKHQPIHSGRLFILLLIFTGTGRCIKV